MNVADLIFPKTCLGCGCGNNYICNNCLLKMRYANQVCVECEKSSIDGMTHSKCKTKFSLDALYTVWQYEGVVRKTIIKLKYGFAYDTAQELATNVSQLLLTRSCIFSKNSTLIPVPLHLKRKNWRGFNQTEMLGSVLSKKLGWGFDSDLLIRVKEGVPQTTLSMNSRTTNLKNIFKVNSFKKYNKDINWILFDDVTTTGSTIKESAKALKRNGFKVVLGLTICK